MSVKELTPIPEKLKGYQCSIVADSINANNGIRLISAKIKYPLMVHAEFCRHRCFSRSVASNRAIPTAKIIQMVMEDPFIPERFPINKPGMQAEEFYEPGSSEYQVCKELWLQARDRAVIYVRRLIGEDPYRVLKPGDISVHKQIANRLLSPFQWVTEVITATDWENYFSLRDHSAAQGEIARITRMLRSGIAESKPVPREPVKGISAWHLTFVGEEERHDLFRSGITFLERKDNVILDKLKECVHLHKQNVSMIIPKAVSAARTARTSTTLYDGRLSTVEEDLELYLRLVGTVPRHVSPTEHQARAINSSSYYANFRGWIQHRKEIRDETIHG